jgi:integrase
MGKSKLTSKNKKLDKKIIRKGLSIYKTGSSPYWYARMLVRGERKYVVRSTNETARVNATIAAEELLDDMSRGEALQGTPQKRQFQHFADQLVKDQQRIAGKERAKSFSKNDEQILNRISDGLLTYFGKMDVAEITTPKIREYLNFLDDRREEPLAPSTKEKQVITLRKVLTYAYEEGIIQQLPLKPKIQRKDNPRVAFTELEYKQLLKTTRKLSSEGIKVRGVPLTMELYYFITMVVHTFMRPTEGEIFNIKHKDIKLVKNPTSLEIKCIEGKTGSRTLNTTTDAVEMYKHQKELHPDHTADDYILYPQYKNRSTALRSVNRLFNYVLDAASLKTNANDEKLVPYSLRHYCLRTRLKKSGGEINVFILAKNAGTSVDQLERFYIREMELTDKERQNLLIKN